MQTEKMQLPLSDKKRKGFQVRERKWGRISKQIIMHVKAPWINKDVTESAENDQGERHSDVSFLSLFYSSPEILAISIWVPEWHHAIDS